MKKIPMVVIGLCFVASLVGCETMKGMGQDLKNTGNNIVDLFSGKKADTQVNTTSATKK